jgi:hypothetical protein
MAEFQDIIIIKQIKELYDNFHEDKIKYFGKPITEEILTNYEESTSWMRANIFISENRILNKIAIGFIGTGGGANLFDYFFRDKSSRAMIFADMPYYQEATYSENEYAFYQYGIILENDKFFKIFEDGSKQQISSTSEHIAEVLCKSCLNKLNLILDLNSKSPIQFTNYIPISLTVDFGSENDKPARFFVGCGTNIFGYLFSKKDSREKMNNTIAIIVLNILSNEINYPDYLYNCVEIKEFPKRTVELIKEENKKYYDNLYKLSY